jgi:hypothetical protein
MGILSKTATRVEDHTPPQLNERIRARTERGLVRYAEAGPHAVFDRLEELDWEWDMERALEANAAVLALAGLALGAAGRGRWRLLSAAVLGFLLQHAVQGWCPPIRLFRRLGFRTAREIEWERHVLLGFLGARDV